MRRTYKSKKETAGAIDPRDVLLTLDAKSSIFDAFYIQNIKKTKKDMSIGSTMQFAASNKVRKRKYVKRLKEQASFLPRESTSNTVFLTPDKSFRVNKAPDLFDQLLNSSCNKVETAEPVSFKKTRAIPQKTYIKKRPIKKKSYYSNSESSDSDKENFNSSEESNRTANTSDIRIHKLIIEKELKTSPKIIDESLNNIVNNLSIFSDRKKHTALNPNHGNHNLTKLGPLQSSPLCSTPFIKKYRGASIYRFSPISINVNDSPKHVTVMEDVNDYSRNNSQITPKAKNKVNNYKIDNQIIKDATIIEKIKQSIVPENEEYNDMNNENNTATASIVYDSVHETSNKTEIQSPILPNRTTNNKRESTKHSSYLSYMQTTELEPFHGFEDIDLIKNDKLEAINYKYMEMEKIVVDKSNATTPKRLSQNSTFVNSNINIIKDTVSSNSNTSPSVESSDIESFYDTCNSDTDNKEQVQKLEPIVVVERLNSSMFEQYYSQMANYSINNNDSKTSSDSSDYASVRLSDNVSNISSNNSVISENSTEDNNSNISIGNDENNESIGSNEIDNNDYSIESKPEDVFVSFVTTRRRNEFHNDSLLGFGNSIVSAGSHEYDKTVLTNKNILENTNYVTLDENIVNSIDETSNVGDEEIDQDIDTECKYISESNEISKTVLSPKVRKIFTRKSARESFKAKKNKSPNHKRPAIKNNADDSLNIETEEKDQSKTEFKSSNSQSDEIIRTTLSPKLKKIITRKSARESIKALKSNSPCNIRYSQSRETADERDYSSNISTRKGSRVYRDSIARESQTFMGYKDNMGNESISSEQPGIILQPGKRWERSLSIYRRMTTMIDHCDNSILDEEQSKSRKYRQSVIYPLELQDLKGSFHNDSINSRRSTFVSKPSRSTIKIVRESNTSRASLCSTIVCEDLEGFLGEDCDDTIVELSKLSIADSEHEVTIIEKFHDTSNRRTTARDYVLRRCNQADVLPFDECYPDTVLKNCRKIGEGVYGEVFLWRAGDGRARVLKVIPIAGDIKVNGEQQKDFHEIISEIVIAMELSALRAPIADIEQHLNEGKTLETLDLHSVENATDAFNEVLRVRCVRGRYPSRLLELWELYDECRGSENDSPATLPPQQQYVVLELANAGEDLESYHFINAEQAYALFKQIAFGLAVAEEAFQFEHRDLHWGNVLISPTEEKYASFVVRGAVRLVRRCGVRASLIDYSLSRATLGRCALYSDLAHDDALFDALGDYQFQLYRLMRDKLGNDWKTFEPYTNVLWLHYTVDKMITALRYTRTNTKIHKHYIAKLKEIKNRILDYGSAVQYVLADNEL